MGLQVERGELYLAVNAQYSLILRSSGPHLQLKSQLYQPLFLFAPKPVGFSQVSVSMWYVYLLLHEALPCLYPTLWPCVDQNPPWTHFFYGGLELSDAAVMVFLLCGGEVVVSTAAAANFFALYSSRGKGGFKLREEFIDLVLLTGVGSSELVERRLDDLVYMYGGGCQVVGMGVKIIGQVCALR